MVKNKKIIKKLLIISVLSLMLMIIYKNTEITFCEIAMMSQEEALIELKENVYSHLHDVVRRESFKTIYENTWIYSKMIVKEEFLREFIENIQWLNFLEENKDLSSEHIMNKISEMFMSHIETLQQHWIENYRKNKEQAIVNAINYCTNLIKQSFCLLTDYNTIKQGIYLLNDYKTIIPWVIPASMVSCMFIHAPLNYPVFMEIIGPFVDQIDIIRMTIPQIPFQQTNNFAIILQNINFYCITPQAWENFQETEQWKNIINNNHKIMLGLGLFITIIVVKSLFP